MENVVLVTVDSLRGDYVFGPNAPTSLEAIPRLADRGAAFVNGFSNAAYTKQSFRSVFSGTYPWMFYSGQAGYGNDRPHIAEALSAAGYDTAAFNTNVYLGPTYNYDRGFEHYLRRGDGDAPEGRSTLEEAYKELIDTAVSTRLISDGVHAAYEAAGKYLGIQLGSRLYMPAEELNDAAIEWVRGRSSPVFLWIHYMDVHNPYYPHEGTVSEGIDRRTAIKLFHRVNQAGSDASSDALDTLERLYRGEIEYLDAQIGDLLDRIDDTLGLDATTIAFTSDHGEAFGEHGNVYHPGSALYDENIHVPIILAGPDVESGTVETPVSNLDLAPTLLSRVGVDVPEAMVGEDIAAFVTRPPTDRLVFAEAYNRHDGNAMVTDGRFKLIRDLETGSESLYDRRGEAGETSDRTDTLPDASERLAAALDDHVRTIERFEGDDADVDVPEHVRLRLRKLGYAE
jgi:arylsulfatase A-like enzyme